MLRVNIEHSNSKRKTCDMAIFNGDGISLLVWIPMHVCRFNVCSMESVKKSFHCFWRHPARWTQFEKHQPLSKLQHYRDGLVQDFSNSISNALELLQFCTKPSICSFTILIIEWLIFFILLQHDVSQTNAAAVRIHPSHPLCINHNLYWDCLYF